MSSRVGILALPGMMSLMAAASFMDSGEEIHVIRAVEPAPTISLEPLNGPRRKTPDLHREFQAASERHLHIAAAEEKRRRRAAKRAAEPKGWK